MFFRVCKTELFMLRKCKNKRKSDLSFANLLAARLSNAAIGVEIRVAKSSIHTQETGIFVTAIGMNDLSKIYLPWNT